MSVELLFVSVLLALSILNWGLAGTSKDGKLGTVEIRVTIPALAQ